MGFYQDRILPHLTDRVCGVEGFDRWRSEAVDGLSGEVVELGFGSGRNVSLYPDEITRVAAVEPSAVARRLAEPRVESRGIPVDHVGLDGATLPLADASADGVLATFTLCTIPDVERALAEVARVLRPGGRFHILEHGAAPDAGVARWQRRLEPIQKRLAGGCHLTRRPLELLEAAGFEIETSRSRYGRGPKPMTYLTVAHAIRPS